MKKIENKRRRKRSITLIEIIVVMLLIATITGAVAYNYRDSLNQGKAFKTKEALGRIETILNLALMEDSEISNVIVQNWKNYVQQSPLVQNPQQYFKDGWGGEYTVTLEDDGSGQKYARVKSQNYDNFEQKKKGQSQSQPQAQRQS